VIDMSGLEEDAQARTGGRGPTCQVSALLNYLPGDAAEHVEKALANPDITSTGLFRAIRDRMGDSRWTPSIWSIGNHRRGNCRCGR
jgi:hypothetical protein